MSSRLSKNIWSGCVICPTFSSSVSVARSLLTSGSNDERRGVSGAEGSASRIGRKPRPDTVGASVEPNAPSVPARNSRGVVDALGIEPGAELAIRLNQAILGTAGNPEQAELGVGARAELWELGAKFLAKPARAEGAHVGEMVERVQAGVKRLAAAHRKPR